MFLVVLLNWKPPKNYYHLIKVINIQNKKLYPVITNKHRKSKSYSHLIKVISVQIMLSSSDGEHEISEESPWVADRVASFIGFDRCSEGEDERARRSRRDDRESLRPSWVSIALLTERVFVPRGSSIVSDGEAERRQRNKIKEKRKKNLVSFLCWHVLVKPH